MKSIVSILLLGVLLIFTSCDRKENQSQTLLLSSTLEEIIFPSTDPNQDTTKYEVLLFDSSIEYFVKKKVYAEAQTPNIFIEDLVVSGGEMKLTRDVLKDSLLYVNEYCKSVDIISRMGDQELLLASVSMDSINPAPLIIKHSNNIGIFKTGRLYMVLRYNRKLNTKRYFKWEVQFDVRYSYDGN